MGPLRRSDVPLSAVDFHVSDINAHLMAVPEVQQAAGALAPAGGLASPDDSLRAAMWLFRSSTNHKKELPQGGRAKQGGCGGADGPDAGERRELQPLWSAAAQHADRFSVQHIARRFGRPQ